MMKHSITFYGYHKHLENVLDMWNASVNWNNIFNELLHDERYKGCHKSYPLYQLKNGVLFNKYLELRHIEWSNYELKLNDLSRLDLIKVLSPICYLDLDIIWYNERFVRTVKVGTLVGILLLNMGVLYDMVNDLELK